MSTTYDRASIIISIYNNVQALKLVLDSLSLQTDRRFEVIVSEDACHPSVKDFLSSYRFEGDLTHLSHPDVGWTKNIALNKAIRAAKSDYLIFVDGDCIVHPRFVEYHLKLASDKAILAGKRIKLDSFTSQAVIDNTILLSELPRFVHRNIFKIRKMGGSFVEEGIFMGDSGFFGFIPKLRRMTNLKGCNMSFSKTAAFAINGFDEDYLAPAIGEDIDLTWRFMRAGYHLKSVRNLAVQYHLHHKENWSDQSDNQMMMNNKQNQDLWFCNNGLIKEDCS